MSWHPASRESNKRHNKKHKEEGLCHCCSEPSVRGGLCLKHSNLAKEKRGVYVKQLRERMSSARKTLFLPKTLKKPHLHLKQKERDEITCFKRVEKRALMLGFSPQTAKAFVADGALLAAREKQLNKEVI